MSNTENNIKSIKIEKNKIRNYFYFSFILAMILLVFLLSIFYSNSIKREYKIKIEQLSTSIINEKKRFLRNAIDRTFHLIENERLLVREELSGKNLTDQQLEEICMERIGQHIRNLRLIDDGYIWVNWIINYEGGDNYAIRKIHPNLPETEGIWLSTNTTDIKGNRPYEIELNGIKKAGELYFEYYFKKMNSEKIAHKMSYAKLYKPYDWVVATGVYLDDVDELVKSETERMHTTYQAQLIRTFSIAMIGFIFSVFIMIIFEKFIHKLIFTYESKIESHTSEVKQLKGLLPICSNCKKIRDDEGYWSQIETYISKRSAAEFSHGICPDCAKKIYPEVDIEDYR
ncbi:MAG: cache domain-containing protein [Spirochaetes bacterium]|nr:cache domain-containing protein [Spirochaetota bacterium]